MKLLRIMPVLLILALTACQTTRPQEPDGGLGGTGRSGCPDRSASPAGDTRTSAEGCPQAKVRVVQ